MSANYYKRYRIKAKRKNTDEPYTDWTSVNDYKSAMKHVAHVREVGYDSKLCPCEDVKKLWYFLGEKETALTDEILDAGFGLVDGHINTVLSDLKKAIHDKAIYPHGEECSYIPLKVFDAVLQGFIRKGVINEISED